MFMPPPSPRRKGPPAVTYGATGHLTLNAAAREIFEIRSVELAYDRETRRIRIAPANAGDHRTTFRVSKQGQISGAAFAKYFGIEPGTRWGLDLVSGELIGTEQ